MCPQISELAEVFEIEFSKKTAESGKFPAFFPATGEFATEVNRRIVPRRRLRTGRGCRAILAAGPPAPVGLSCRRQGAAMFANVLIANRGEIACRVIRTARRLGIRAIALHTPADRGALFTRIADEAIEIGEGATGYLDGEEIVAAAVAAGAQCLHPGYGFR